MPEGIYHYKGCQESTSRVWGFFTVFQGSIVVRPAWGPSKKERGISQRHVPVSWATD